MQEKNFHISLLKNYEYKMIWNLSNSCNYSCSYCYNRPVPGKKEITDSFSPEQISKCFDDTHKRWLILISGGEPFLVPQFPELLKNLSANHHVQITTNLTSPHLDHLEDYINPSRIMMISASLHASERETKDPGFNKFIDRYISLEKKGYRMLINYVSYPPLFTRIEKDFNYLHEKGIHDITVLTYRGKWEGKDYPGSYTKEQRRIISQLAIDKAEDLIAGQHTNYKGIRCEAGHKFFSMDSIGNINRCGTVDTCNGNLFDGTFKLNNSDLPCPSKECIDCYLGIVSLRPNGFQKISNKIPFMIRKW